MNFIVCRLRGSNRFFLFNQTTNSYKITIQNRFIYYNKTYLPRIRKDIDYEMTLRKTNSYIHTLMDYLISNELYSNNENKPKKLKVISRLSMSKICNFSYKTDIFLRFYDSLNTNVSVNNIISKMVELYGNEIIKETILALCKLKLDKKDIYCKMQLLEIQIVSLSRNVFKNKEKLASNNKIINNKIYKNIHMSDNGNYNLNKNIASFPYNIMQRLKEIKNISEFLHKSWRSMNDLNILKKKYMDIKININLYFKYINMRKSLKVIDFNSDNIRSLTKYEASVNTYLNKNKKSSIKKYRFIKTINDTLLSNEDFALNKNDMINLMYRVKSWEERYIFHISREILFNRVFYKEYVDNKHNIKLNFLLKYVKKLIHSEVQYIMFKDIVTKNKNPYINNPICDVRLEIINAVRYTPRGLTDPNWLYGRNEAHVRFCIFSWIENIYSWHEALKLMKVYEENIYKERYIIKTIFKSFNFRFYETEKIRIVCSDILENISNNILSKYCLKQKRKRVLQIV